MHQGVHGSVRQFGQMVTTGYSAPFRLVRIIPRLAQPLRIRAPDGSFGSKRHPIRLLFDPEEERPVAVRRLQLDTIRNSAFAGLEGLSRQRPTQVRPRNPKAIASGMGAR